MSTFRIGGGWGDSISWWGERDEEDLPGITPMKVVGWKDPKPRVGDDLLSGMRSGKTGKFRFVAIRPCRDPRDMFYADVEFIGYEEPPAALKAEQESR